MSAGSRLGVLANDALSPRVNWTTLGPPVTRSLVRDFGAHAIRPPALSRDHASEWRAVHRDVRNSASLFWMQLAARPENPLLAALALGPLKRRSAYVLDAWPYTIPNLAVFARAARLRPCFVAMREGVEALSHAAPKVNVVHLPFAADLDVFVAPPDGERDIFAFSMGRSHAPLHHALKDYCAERGLTYASSTGGRITDARDLGRMVARSKYFVVTPPDLDHPERAGGFSPLVMRYLEGLAAGARLLGTLPRSGEFEKILPSESILQVSSDGHDLAARLDADTKDDSGFAATREACRIVRAEHGWQHRAQTIHDAIAAYD